jgi:hypothetical protein
MDKQPVFLCKNTDRKHGVGVVKLFIHNKKKCTFYIYIYTHTHNRISFLNISLSLTPSSGSSTPRFKTYCNIRDYIFTVHIMFLFLQLRQIVWVPQTVTKVVIAYLVTPCSRVLLEKLIGSQSRVSPHFMETEGSLPLSQGPATCPHPKPDRSSPYPHNSLPENPS